MTRKANRDPAAGSGAATAGTVPGSATGRADTGTTARSRQGAATAGTVPGSATGRADTGTTARSHQGAATAGTVPGTATSRADLNIGVPHDGSAPSTAPAHVRDPVAVRAFIERFTGMLVMSGFPRTPARIFVAMLTSDSSRLTAAELGELLQASPASISGGARYLLQVGLISAEGEPGSRRLHYRMSEDVWPDLVRMRDRQFTTWATELRDGVDVLGSDSPAGSRMAQTVSYFEFISSEMSGLLARWDERKAAGSGRSGR